MQFIRFLQTTTFATVLTFCLMSTGCVYTIDLPQGTPITQSKATKVKIGMSKNQVLYLLGSPALRDSLSPNRWDYIYNYKAGTDGRRNNKPDIKNASQYLSVHFDNNGLVSHIDGLQSLPKQ